jgi:hypothetical protein
MAGKSIFNKGIVVSAVVIFLVLGAVWAGYSGVEPPGGAKPTGKAVKAILTAVQIDISGYPVVVNVLVGSCSAGTFQIGPLVNPEGFINPSNIAKITEEGDCGLLNKVINDITDPCFNDGYQCNLVITRVNSFYNSGTTVSAEVLLQHY